MKLSFYARGNLKVPLPGQGAVQGQSRRYIGRECVPGDGKTKGAQHPATREPFVCESGTPRARQLIEEVTKWESLWPADEETARFCGVPFVSVEFSDGAWSDPRVHTKRDGKPKNFMRAAQVAASLDMPTVDDKPVKRSSSSQKASAE